MISTLAADVGGSDGAIKEDTVREYLEALRRNLDTMQASLDRIFFDGYTPASEVDRVASRWGSMTIYIAAPRDDGKSRTGRDRFLAGVLACAAILGLCSATGAQEDLWPDLSSPPKAAGGGERDAAVIVGAEKYAFVEPVGGAERNAEDWRVYLEKTRQVPVASVIPLLSEDATLENMRRAAKEAAAKVAPGGTLWFVFIGHGAPAQKGADGLLVGIDAQQKAESIYERSLPREELLRLLAAGKQARTVVLLDACFSGKSHSGRELVAGLQPLVATRALPLGIDNRMILMTAAKSDQFAGPLPGGDRPAFSYLALGALRGWAADSKGEVTAAALLGYVKTVLGFARDRRQTPDMIATGGGAVVLGRGREAGPDLTALQGAAARSSGGGFHISAANLPAMPRAQAPANMEAAAGGMDFSSVDVDALEKYGAALKTDKGDASPEEKAEGWRQLAQDAPKFADVAGKRAAEWDAFAAQKKAAEAATPSAPRRATRTGRSCRACWRSTRPWCPRPTRRAGARNS